VRRGAQAIGVTRPTRGERLVADPTAVDLRLVDAVRRDVQAGGLEARADGEVASQQGWPASVAVGILVPVCGDRLRDPVARGQEAGLDRRCRPPVGPIGGVRLGPCGAPHPDANGGDLAGAEWFARPGDEDRFAGGDPSGGGHPIASRDLDLGGTLLPAGRAEVRPAEPGLRHTDTAGVAEMLESGSARGHHRGCWSFRQAGRVAAREAINSDTFQKRIVQRAQAQKRELQPTS
jgi:hypothetical protein